MKEKHITVVTLIILAVFLVVISIIMVGADSIEQNGVESPYVGAYFNPHTVNTVSITIAENDWQDIIDNPLAEEWHICNIDINGDSYIGTAIRIKGQSSLSMLTMYNSDRYSFKIKADEYVNGQTFKGLKEFCINCFYQDPTSMKEYLSYELMTKLGVPTPLYSYVAVYINGEYYGLYLMLESVETDFAARNFGKNYGQIYKPEYLEQGNIDNKFGDKMQNMDYRAGTTLKYVDDNPFSYHAIFDNAVYTTTSTAVSKERVIEAIKNLNMGNPADAIVVDEALKFIAGLGSVVSLDSYIGSMCHNYFLYEEEGKLQMIPWDFNNAFGTFRGIEASNAVNFPIDTPVESWITLSDRPLVEKLLAVDEYKRLYHTYMKWIAENYFNSSFSSHVDSIEMMIGEYIKNDPTAFYSYENHLEALPNLKLFGELRGKSILGQLNGTIPSTREGQNVDNSVLIDVTGLDMNALTGGWGIQTRGKGTNHN